MNFQQLEQIHDQYLSFITPSSVLFSTLPNNDQYIMSSVSRRNCSYFILNSVNSTEEQIEAETERVANCLFSVVATLGKLYGKLLSCLIFLVGQVPYIRCPKGNAAEMIARKLGLKIRDAILSSSHSTCFQPLNAISLPEDIGISSLQRPCESGGVIISMNF